MDGWRGPTVLGGLQKWLTLYTVRFDEMGVVSIRVVRGVVLAVISCGLT